MKAKLSFSLAVLFLCTNLSGCAMARHVLVEGNGGVVAIPDNIDIHRERAGQMMHDQCPNGYRIVKEEEVITGTTTKTKTVTEETKDGEEGKEISTTRDDTEWQITYECE